MTDLNEECGNCDARQMYHRGGYCPTADGWSTTERFEPPVRRELDAVRGTRPALPSPIGEPQPGAPEGYRYGDAWQDVVQICRDATQEEAVAFLRLRFGALDAVRVLDAWAKKHEEATPPTPIFHRYMSPVPGRGMMGCWLVVLPNLTRHSAATAAEARAAAAKALLEEDPTLGTEA